MLDIHPLSSDHLRALLGIQDGSVLSCHGQRKKGGNCTIRIAQSNTALIATLLDQLHATKDDEVARSLLTDLSCLLMCKRFHQNQGAIFLQRLEKKWKQDAKKTTPATTSQAKTATQSTARKSSPPATEVPKALVNKTKIYLPRQPRSTEPRILETKVEEGEDHLPREPSTPEPRAYKTETEATRDRRRTHIEKQTDDSEKTPTASKAQSSVLAQEDAEIHKFVPYGERKNLAQLNTHVKAHLLKPLSNHEQTNLDGYIYMYTFPEHYRRAAPCIKIGYTNDVDRRGREWAIKCGYTPKVLSHFGCEHYIRIERLVHAVLYNQRLREKSCPGPRCGTSHKEWFKVRSTRAVAVAELWAHWMRQQPYDDQGTLKEVWVERLESLDMGNRRCWEEFVFGEDEADDY